MTSTGAHAYADAGVNLDAADAVIGRLLPHLRRTWAGDATDQQPLELPGGYAGGVALPDGRVLAATGDGAGSKLELAREHGALRGAGSDVVAMCVNDLACTGIDPLLLLDYVAAHALELDELEAVVAGVADGCVAAGCMLVGGETAELPGLLREGALDAAATAIGIAAPDAILNPAAATVGDPVIALASTGPHANGFTLLRREFALAGDLDIARRALTPTAIYVQELRVLRQAGLLTAAAHITGGGLPGNVPRMLVPDHAVVLDRGTWRPEPVSLWMADRLACPVDELADVLNLGIGMTISVPRAEVDAALDLLDPLPAAAWVCGTIVAARHGEPAVSFHGDWSQT